MVKPVYCGPGIWYDKDRGRIHVRLAHTNIRLPEEAQHTVVNYRGERDPRRLPLVIAPLFRLGIGIGWIVLFTHAYAAFSKSGKTRGQFTAGLFRKIPVRVYLQAIAVTVFTFVVMLPIHYSDYRFMTDDVIYFAPLVETFLADYTGGIRVPTYYPALMTSHKLAPTMALAVLCGLLPKVTLVHAVEARYLLMSAFLARVLFLLWRRSESSGVVFIPVAICMIFLIRTELSILIHLRTGGNKGHASLHSTRTMESRNDRTIHGCLGIRADFI